MYRKTLIALRKWKEERERKPLIIKGARQVGKTYLLKQFGKEYFPNFHYLNFEETNSLSLIFASDLVPKNLIQQLNIFLNTSINIETDLIVFDEIQACPNALTSLKYFHEELPQLAICAAGSLLGLNLTPHTFPVGKINFMQLNPMTFDEFLLGTGHTELYEFLNSFQFNDKIPGFIHLKLWEYFKYYLIVGGLPEIVATYNDLQSNLYEAVTRVRERQNKLSIGYIADMAKHSGKQNAMHLERLWRNIPAQLAKEQQSSGSRFQFKGIIPGINRYTQLVHALDWLITAGLVIKTHILNHIEIPLMAYNVENCFKLYLLDVGMLGSLTQLSPQSILSYDYGTYKGYFAENFVAQELFNSENDSLYSWRGRESEIEFVLDYNGQIIPIEVKAGSVTRSKSMSTFSEKYNPKLHIVFSAKNFLWIEEKKRIQCPIYLAGYLNKLIKKYIQ